MKKTLCALLVGYSCLLSAPITMENGYIKVGVGDDGSFGAGGSTPPGIMFDDTGLGNYGVDDYLIPGDPFEFFTITYNDITLTNKNNATAKIPTVISGDASQVTSISTIADTLLITQTYTLNAGSKAITINATVENISGASLINVQFARGLDPDVDVLAHSVYDTINDRGLSFADGSAISSENIVTAIGANTGKIVSLFTNDPITHNTSVTEAWSVVPATILTGINDGNGDYAIGLAFDIGTIAAGESVNFSYNYIASKDLNDMQSIVTTDDSILSDGTTSAVDDTPVTTTVSVPLFGPFGYLIISLLFGFFGINSLKNRNS